MSERLEYLAGELRAAVSEGRFEEAHFILGDYSRLVDQAVRTLEEDDVERVLLAATETLQLSRAVALAGRSQIASQLHGMAVAAAYRPASLRSALDLAG